MARILQKTLDENINEGALLALATRLEAQAETLHDDSTWVDDQTRARNLMARARNAASCAEHLRQAARLMHENTALAYDWLYGRDEFCEESGVRRSECVGCKEER